MTLRRLLFLILFTPLLAPIGAYADGLPAACQTQCIAPYGQALGADSTMVKAYSNCNAECVVYDSNEQDGTYTGIRWQCVEYARRWLLSNRGVVFGDVDVAADIWALNDVRRVADDARLPLESYLNGASQPPTTGDLLIYGRDYLKTGHVAVVTRVDRDKGIVDVAEQNFLNEQWSDEFARELRLVEDKGRYWVLDPYLIGWKRVVTETR